MFRVDYLSYAVTIDSFLFPWYSLTTCKIESNVFLSPSQAVNQTYLLNNGNKNFVTKKASDIV